MLNQIGELLAREDDSVVSDFLCRLRQVLERDGLSVAMACLALTPIAHAKGDSKAELDLMLNRFDLGLMTNAFLTLNPRNTRFPVEVVSTGRIGPSGMGIATVTA